MTLRLRRGTDLERQGIVFDLGELIYVTDTKEIYVGDGVTEGGIRVTGDVDDSPALLTQNLNLNNFDITGTGSITATEFIGNGSQLTDLPIPYDNVLNTFTGSFIGDGSQLTNLPPADSNFAEGETYSINIRGGDGTTIVDTFDNTFTGVFVGDGSQLTNLPTIIEGGTYQFNITGENSQVIVDTSTNTFTGSFIGDGSQLTNLPETGTGIAEGETYSINIRGGDGTTIVDTFDNTFTGVFVGDGSQLTNLPILIEGGTYQFNITGENSQVIVDTSTNTFTGSFIGDGSQLTNLPISEFGIVEGGTYQFNITGENSQVIVDTVSNTFFGNFVGEFVGDGSQLTNLPQPNIDGINPGESYYINILGADSSIILDADNNVFFGEVIGDIEGNVLGFDSTILVDNTTNTINSNDLNVSNKLAFDHNSFDYQYIIEINPVSPRGSIRKEVTLNVSDQGFLDLTRVSAGTFDIPTAVSSSSSLYSLVVQAHDGTNFNTSGIMSFATDGAVSTGIVPTKFLITVADSSGVIDLNSGIHYNANQNVGIMNADPQSTLDVDGDANFTESVTVGTYTQFGSLTTTERNLLTATNGMVIYNSTVNRFQGYQNSGWINLDDGTAG